MSEGRAWTQDDVAKLVAMLRDGGTTKEAADALGRDAVIRGRSRPLIRGECQVDFSHNMSKK